MAGKEIVTTGIAVVYFRYPDGCVLRCKCSANEDTIKEHGIMPSEEPCLYDLEVKKKIPESILELESTVYSLDEDVDQRIELDKFFGNYVKNLW